MEDISSDQASATIRREVQKLLCDPCSENGKNIEAAGFCVDCEEHLCDNCFKHHCVPKPMKNHQLLDKQQMPQTKGSGVYKDECTDKCQTHKDEVVKYYCEDHKTFGCTVCVTLGHRSCNVGYVPTLASDLFNSEDYKTFRLALDNLKKKTSHMKDRSRNNAKATNAYADRAFAAIRTMRKQIDDFFDDLERKVSSEVSKVQRENENKIKLVQKQCNELADEIQQMKQTLLQKEKRGLKCQLFVDMKEQRDKIDKLDSELLEFQKSNTIREMVFRPSTFINDFITDQSRVFGSLVSFYETIRVDLPTDNELCFIGDVAVLSDGRIVVYDFNNKTVKLVDTKHGKVKTETLLSDIGCRVVSMPDNKIAVVSYNDINIYSVTDQLHLRKSARITVPPLRTFVYTNNMFIGFTQSEPPTFCTMDMQGKVTKSFPIETNGENMFEKPYYISLSRDHTLMYVVDWGNNTVTCLTLKGEVRARYNPEMDWMPRGVAVSRDGDVYVCDCENSNIHILTSELKEKDVIIDEPYINRPTGLAYRDRECKLYVGMYDKKYVGVFNI